MLEHRQDPGSSRLRRLVPTVGSFFCQLRLVDAFREYDQFFALSRRRHVPPNFAEIRHILNIAQVRRGSALSLQIILSTRAASMLPLIIPALSVYKSKRAAAITVNRFNAETLDTYARRDCAVLAPARPHTPFVLSPSLPASRPPARPPALQAPCFARPPAAPCRPPPLADASECVTMNHLNFCRLQVHSSADTLRLITFDADGTLYADGAAIERNNAMIGHIINLMRSNVHVAIVTAAGYPGDAGKFSKRVAGLLDAFKRLNLPVDITNR